MELGGPLMKFAESVVMLMSSAAPFQDGGRQPLAAPTKKDRQDHPTRARESRHA